MHLIFFYKISDLKNILNYIDILNKTFEKYFWIKYEWVDCKDYKEFLKKKDSETWIIYWFQTKNNLWIYNEIIFAEDNFSIILFFSERTFNRNNFFSRKEVFEIEEKVKKMTFEIFEKSPLIWAISTSINNYLSEDPYKIEDLDNQEMLEYTALNFKKENSEIKVIEWDIILNWDPRNL